MIQRSETDSELGTDHDATEGGVFPCGLHSFRIGKASSPDCDLCGAMETPSHILCNYKQLKNIITASHDKIWRLLYKLLTGSLPEWKLHYDSPIGKMPLTDLTRDITGLVCNRKLDGVAQRSTQNECFRLEFTRTTDFWATSLDVA
eukprot:1976597-Rhodomonas_salina.3